MHPPWIARNLRGWPPPRFVTRIQLFSERGFGSFRNAGHMVSGKWFLEVVSGEWFLGSGFWGVVFGKWLLGSGFWGVVFGKWLLGSGFGEWFLGSVFLGSGEGLSPTQRRPKEARP